ELAIGAMIKNEARDLREWIEFHLLVGVEKFYIFNNLSTDRSVEILQPYIQRGIVDLHQWPITCQHGDRDGFLSMHCGALRRIVDLYAAESKWIAFIDSDEFIVPVKSHSIVDLLREYEDVGGLSVNWVNFGTSHVEKLPQ